jgi:hypothetical protein
MLLVIRSALWKATQTAASALALLLASCGPPDVPQDRAEPGALGEALQHQDKAPPATAASQTPAAAAPIPYVVIRFERPGIAFEDALYSALTRALERYPAVQFDVVLAMPVLSPHGNPTEAVRLGESHLEDVVLAMTDMGLPAERLRVAASTEDTVSVDEVRIFVR